ncbi:MAG: radical SAM peptide maturase, CXXX-repeat target family [Lachnospiraceae bacterium]|nr:radical SAM peptide maturase, CXXX-repeat target family [Lachnospiraceae bacterium]
MKEQYLMGKNIGLSWRLEEVQQFTFVVTQECNLACKYCYMHGKNTESIMTFETAKAAVDYFIDDANNNFDTSYVIIEFIGGEPLLEIDLIDQVVDYFKLRMYQKKSKWFGRYRISIGSNGVLYDDERVQKFIQKNYKMLSIGITIDGIKEKHDLNRIFPDNSGSYDIVRKNIELLLKKFPESVTKVTISHEDIPYIKESIIHLWELGLNEIPANVVFEDVWKEGDAELFEKQLVELADYIVDNCLWNKFNCSLFQENIGFHYKEKDTMLSVCGTGKMISVDAKGDIYSCIRFMDYSLVNKKAIRYGNIREGIDKDKIRPFNALSIKYLSPQKCLDCMINSECSYCAGYNYDASEKDTLFDREVSICEMHKARVRANRYYWARLYNEHGIRRMGYRKPEKFMFFLLSVDSISFCNYENKENKEKMTPELLIKGLDYSYQNFYFPVFIHSKESEALINEWCINNELLKNALNKHIIRHIMPFTNQTKYKREDIIYVFDGDNFVFDKDNFSNKYNTAILKISNKSVNKLASQTEILLNHFHRININLFLPDKIFDLEEYDRQLKIIAGIISRFAGNEQLKEVNKLTDRIYLEEMNNCFAGEKNITFGTDGKLYLCPAFYYANNSAGDLTDAPNEYLIGQTLFKNAPLCGTCDAYQCNRCVFLNKMWTGEYNVPSKIQCEIAHIERENCRLLLLSLKEGHNHIYEAKISQLDYLDPMEKLLNFQALPCSL